MFSFANKCSPASCAYPVINCTVLWHLRILLIHSQVEKSNVVNNYIYRRFLLYCTEYYQFEVKQKLFKRPKPNKCLMASWSWMQPQNSIVKFFLDEKFQSPYSHVVDIFIFSPFITSPREIGNIKILAPEIIYNFDSSWSRNNFQR